MSTQIRTEHYANIEDALAKHKEITGSDFFECYENSKHSIVRAAESGRISEYMVDLATGDIYYIFDCPDHLLVLNRLSLHACLHNGPFHEVFVGEYTITFHRDGHRGYSRSKESRKELAAASTIVEC